MTSVRTEEYNWWRSTYAREIEKLLKVKENNRMQFFRQSPQMNYRSHLVNWVRELSERLQLNPVSVHLGMHLLDFFMDKHAIVLHRLKLVALVCLLLAAKYEDQIAKVPKLRELRMLLCSDIPQKDYISVELMVFSFFDWSVSFPTVAHFTDYYSLFCTTAKDACTESLLRAAQSTIREFLDLSLQIADLISMRPSRVAASCILGTRQLLGLTPSWPPILKTVTGYSISQLKHCCQLLMAQAENMEPLEKKRKLIESPDGGYSTVTSVDSSPESINPMDCSSY